MTKFKMFEPGKKYIVVDAGGKWTSYLFGT